MAAEFPQSPEALFDELQRRCLACGPLVLKNNVLIGSCGTKSLQITGICPFLIDVYVVGQDAHFNFNVFVSYYFETRRKLSIRNCTSTASLLLAVLGFVRLVKTEYDACMRQREAHINRFQYTAINAQTATTSGSITQHWYGLSTTGTTVYAL